MALTQGLRKCTFFVLPTLSYCFKKGFLFNVHPYRRNLSIDAPTFLYVFLFQKSFSAQDAPEMFLHNQKIIFESQIDP